MAKRRKKSTHKRRKAVTHKRKSVGAVPWNYPKKKRKSSLKGKHHTKWGHVSAHERRLAGLKKRRKKRSKGMGGMSSGSIMKAIVPFAIGFGVAKLMNKA